MWWQLQSLYYKHQSLLVHSARTQYLLAHAGARGPLVAEEERVLKLRQEREQEVQRELEVGGCAGS